MTRRLLLTSAAAAVLAFAAACGGDDNRNGANANGGANRNANTNANATVTATPTPAGSAYNGNYNSREDYTRADANYRSEANRAGQSIGQGAEDGWIHFKVRAALATVDDLRDSTINVDVDNNVVTLRGSVGSNDQKSAAAKAAQGVEGVKSVKNQLTVGGGSNTNSANRAANNNR
ncbi:MAG TPA: BON domain-containing protein [Pyrinomonadaceae bacterium]|nr:BON domain-containing protein [Pyrinomonadaceae bacterium]